MRRVQWEKIRRGSRMVRLIICTLFTLLPCGMALNGAGDIGVEAIGGLVNGRSLMRYESRPVNCNAWDT